MKVDGQCHCGAIAYEAEVQPGSITICHCTDCQTHSGSAFRANIPAPADGFRLTKGTPRTYVKTAASGAKRLLAFCGHCGTPLYACAVEAPAAYSLRIGTIRQRHGLGGPKREIWTKRRLAWVGFSGDVEGFDGQP
ncbi:GFA family protein [Acidovorax sp. GBBC 3334]|uniref:GFA family protein n=1 Tax=Acidovorax sp. GBBC 3334 TaxID=2940496 RepID=UPI0023032796|nr:GFA family protein [Acidovorax sp. GBBC 3334]MDA8457039.1 GFA family protein [Acidovorax sp. GBBC 3334]